jgi:Predicted flavin-nucleotide-binding protein
MKRKDREITNLNEITDILSRCDVVRLGFNGSEYPYVVPLSFGYDVADDKITLYFHGAKIGLKQELIAADSRVCAEADIFGGYTENKYGVTTGYESVIGFGNAEYIYGEEAVKGLQLILEHCGYGSYNLAECGSLDGTLVFKVKLDSVTGKRNVI